MLFGVAAAAPLARVPYFESHDGLNHLWRIWEYARLTGGWPALVRWAPDVAYGFGAPLFTFYNPLAYVLGATFVGLGMTAAGAIKILLAASLIAAPASAFWLGRAVAPGGSTAAGLAAALVYAAAPYRIATVYQRGALAEALALAIAPLVVLGALRASGLGAPSDVCSGRPVGWLRPGAVALLAFSMAVLLLVHTISTVMVAPFVVLIGAAALIGRRGGERRAAANLGAGLVLGIAMGGVFWLPSLAQQSTIQLELARWLASVDAPLKGFVWPWDLVQPSLLHQYGTNFGDPTPAGERISGIDLAAAAALAIGGSVGLVSRRGAFAVRLACLATLLLTLAIASPMAEPLWRRVPALGFFQFGWRLSGLALLAALPLVAGVAAGRARTLRWLVLALAIVSAFGSLAELPIRHLPWSAANERPAELSAYERKSGQFALVSFQEFTPRWTHTSPEQLARLAPPPPASIPAAPAGVRFVNASVDARWYEVDASAPVEVAFDVFFHPDLGVWIDGREASAFPSGEEGLLMVALPAGRHALTLAPRATPVERAAAGISAGAAVLSLGVLIVAPPWFPPRRRRAALVAAASAGAVVGLVLALLPSTPPAAGASGCETISVELGAVARVQGICADRSRVSTTGTLTLDLFVQPMAALARNEIMALKLLDPAGREVVATATGPSAGFRPTSRWRPNELMRLRSELRLPPGLESKTYTIVAELGGGSAVVGEVALPAVAPGAAVPTDPARLHEAVFGDDLILDGYVYSRDPSSGYLDGSFWWRVARPESLRAYDVTYRLTDKQGAVLASDTVRTGGSGGLRPQADFLLRLPEPLLPESYQLELLVRRDDGTPLQARASDGRVDQALRLTWLDVRDPALQVPADARLLNQRFAEGITLVASSLARNGDDLLVSLFWRVELSPTTNFTVFVHALKGDDTVAQIDAQPNAGRRPTGSWQPGELIHDRYRLRVPRGSATAIRVGLYTPENGRRLPLDPPNPENAVRFVVDEGR